MPELPDANRREFLKRATATSLAAGCASASGELALAAPQDVASETLFSFACADTLVHDAGWESLNPGYWKIENGALRRRLKNVGDRARRTGFPFHEATRGNTLNTAYDPSLPLGILYRRDWKLEGAYSLTATFTFRGERPSVPEGDDAAWKMYQDGYGLMGLAIGSKSLFESYGKARNAIVVGWTDAGTLQFYFGNQKNKKRVAAQASAKAAAPALKAGDEVELQVLVKPLGEGRCKVTATLTIGSDKSVASVNVSQTQAQGYVGVASRGLIDFEMNSLEISPGENERLNIGHADCFACYSLGDTLKQVDGKWQVRFVSLFASDGREAEIRIADTESPDGGWDRVPVAGSAKIISNDWRRNTAIIDASLPASPADTTLYYTVWKDGVDVTADLRIGTDATGEGTGFVGDVPTDGKYVGRLPQLKAPYKMCGLSCHAITSGLQQRTDDGFKILGGADRWQFRDQPSVESYKHLEEYNFQIMVWEDDVWYMELVLYPPSTDDAYRVVTNSICGPTSRWQMMRHWNVINPGDHDYGMDDVKGPEQLAIRRVDGLGQDASYMRRNFQIVHHLITGEEEVDPLANPKKWRAWKMPGRDFTFVILDSRLWRSSQDVDMWDDAGWGAFKSLYDRTDPTRSLLGEEQFGWLQELIATDSSRLICLTGINGMHTVWTGGYRSGKTPFEDDEPAEFHQRDRVTADYAGWVKAGSDRVLELLGSREGVVSVYGDVHNGCIIKNVEQRVIECSFGPIGRSGGRGVISGFGPKMKDFDGREIEVHALYHARHTDALLSKPAATDPFYWNFLEMEFDTRDVDPKIGLRVRNLIDSPNQAPRGGGSLETLASETGRNVDCRLPEIKTLPNADVRVSDTSGRPVRAVRSLQDGSVPIAGLVDVQPGEQVIVTAFDGTSSASQVVITLPV